MLLLSEMPRLHALLEIIGAGDPELANALGKEAIYVINQKRVACQMSATLAEREHRLYKGLKASIAV